MKCQFPLGKTRGGKKKGLGDVQSTRTICFHPRLQLFGIILSHRISWAPCQAWVGGWCWGRSTRSPSTRWSWVQPACLFLGGDSTLGAIYVQYRALRDGFCGVIANATKFYVCERYQTQQGLGGRPILLCLILQIKPPGFSLLMCVHHKSISKHISFLRLKYVQYWIRRQEIIYRYVKN